MRQVKGQVSPLIFYVIVSLLTPLLLHRNAKSSSSKVSRPVIDVSDDDPLPPSHPSPIEISDDDLPPAST